MFRKKLSGIIVVHGMEVYWVDTRKPETGRCVLRMPLEKILDGATSPAPELRSFKGNYRSLCIVPDHWLGLERYPFQSKRASLIEPFLERKLAAAFPDTPQVGFFFNYRLLGGSGEGAGLLAYFLQDAQGYQLYQALQHLEMAPRYITCPALLWADKLASASGEFHQEGTLLIHMGQRECQLYFYHMGNYLFSRSVALSQDHDRLEALAFEINQSLYMFSQKSKSELNRIYLQAPPSDHPDLFSTALGREVIGLGGLLEEGQGFTISEAPHLDGLLQSKHLTDQVPFLTLTHRRVARELLWEPVQWAGALIGVCLLILLIGDNLVLGRMLDLQMTQQRNVQQQIAKAGAGMSEYDQALDEMLGMVDRPTCAETIRRVLDGLPQGLHVEELAVILEQRPVVKLKAKVRAGDAAQLRSILGTMVAQMKANFIKARNFSMNQIDVRIDPNNEAGAPPQYLIALQMELT